MACKYVAHFLPSASHFLHVAGNWPVSFLDLFVQVMGIAIEMHKQLLAIHILSAVALIASGCSMPRIREIDPRVLMPSDAHAVPARASASTLASTNSGRSGPLNPAAGNPLDEKQSGWAASDRSAPNSRAFQPRSVQSDIQQPPAPGPDNNVSRPESQSKVEIFTTEVGSPVRLEPNANAHSNQTLGQASNQASNQASGGTSNRTSEQDRSERFSVGPTAADLHRSTAALDSAGPAVRREEPIPLVEPSSPSVIAHQKHADSGQASAAIGRESEADHAKLDNRNVQDVEHSDAPDDVTWQSRVRRAITTLERELEADKENLSDDEKSQLNIRLRILNAAVDRREHALQEIKSLPVEQREYWKHQLQSIMLLLQEKGAPSSSRRAALALRELDNAATQLAYQSSLDLKNLAFCSKVDGFGTVTEFPKSEFTADQEVLLYVEIDRFTSEEMTDQRFGGRNTPRYETELRASYQILDSSGRRIDEFDLPLDKQSCRSKRRDYFIAYRLHMPRRVDPGSYSLHLTVEDVKGRKFGNGSIEFKIKGSK